MSGYDMSGEIKNAQTYFKLANIWQLKPPFEIANCYSESVNKIGKSHHLILWQAGLPISGN